jgi:hypothetical protein
MGGADRSSLLEDSCWGRGSLVGGALVGRVDKLLVGG